MKEKDIRRVEANEKRMIISPGSACGEGIGNKLETNWNNLNNFIHELK